jgi:hypothetical protein
MKRVGLLRAAAAAVMFALLSGSAMAVPAIPNDGIFQPLDGTSYTGNPAPAVGNIKDTYEFSVSVVSTNSTTQVQVLADIPPPGIKNLTFTWINAATNAPLGSLVFTDATGTTINPANDKLFQVLTTGTYKLVVTGFGFDEGTGPPHYDFNLAANCDNCGPGPGPDPTPLPDALFLFSSVVISAGVMQWARSRVAKTVAD